MTYIEQIYKVKHLVNGRSQTKEFPTFTEATDFANSVNVAAIEMVSNKKDSWRRVHYYAADLGKGDGLQWYDDKTYQELTKRSTTYPHGSILEVFDLETKKWTLDWIDIKVDKTSDYRLYGPTIRSVEMLRKIQKTVTSLLEEIKNNKVKVDSKERRRQRDRAKREVARKIKRLYES